MAKKRKEMGEDVVLDAPRWEHSVAFQLEKMPDVAAYA
jgi:hypothetical protein